MIAQAEVRQMPFSEKLALLEVLWSELSSEPDLIEIPQWHKEILDERMRAAEDGNSRLLDWDEAKEQIRERIK